MRHGFGLRRVGYSLLIVLNALLWSFTLWSLLDAYVISRPREARIPSIIARDQLNAQTIRATTPQLLQPSDVAVFQNTDQRVDYLIQLTNPNPHWWAEFTYRFQTSDATSARTKRLSSPPLLAT